MSGDNLHEKLNGKVETLVKQQNETAIRQQNLAELIIDMKRGQESRDKAQAKRDEDQANRDREHDHTLNRLDRSITALTVQLEKEPLANNIATRKLLDPVFRRFEAQDDKISELRADTDKKFQNMMLRVIGVLLIAGSGLLAVIFNTMSFDINHNKENRALSADQ